jgi:translation initiation factor IF-3
MNEEIEAKNVRLIDANGEQAGLVSIEDALNQSQAVGLDLVEISPDAEPPVCKIMDYGKKLFEVKKTKSSSAKEAKKIHKLKK